jgi:hypothetical protein
MERFKTLRDVIHFLENLDPEKNFLNIPASENVIPNKLAELYWILGEKDKAIAALDKGLKKFEGKRFGDAELCIPSYTELKIRILKGGPVYTQP